MNTARLIRAARHRSGLTQAELAERLGVAQPAIARWESGRANPPLDTVSSLVAACGLELRVGIGERDLEDATLIEQNLRLSPKQRLDQLERTVQFIARGRRALASRA